MRGLCLVEVYKLLIHYFLQNNWGIEHHSHQRLYAQGTVKPAITVLLPGEAAESAESAGSELVILIGEVAGVTSSELSGKQLILAA